MPQSRRDAPKLAAFRQWVVAAAQSKG